jgi:molecular chaperone GrpE
MSKKKASKEEIDNGAEPMAQATEKGQGSGAEQNGQGTIDDKGVEQPQVEQVDPLVDLQKQIEEAKDKYIRLSAEFDNYRKRTQREKMDLLKYGSEDVLKGVIRLVDDFDRAIKHSESATDVEAMKQGLVLIYGKFSEFLKTNGVQEIEALGMELDTDAHEAITKIPAPEEGLKGKIVDVVEKGFKLNDKVIRFSKVVIGE